jgi:hypothetical protein
MEKSTKRRIEKLGLFVKRDRDDGREREDKLLLVSAAAAASVQRPRLLLLACGDG